MPDCSQLENDLNFVNQEIGTLQTTISEADALLTELSQLAQLLQQLLFECQQGGGEGELPPPESAVVPASMNVFDGMTVDEKRVKLKQLQPYMEAMQRGVHGACVLLGVELKKEAE